MDKLQFLVLIIVNSSRATAWHAAANAGSATLSADIGS